MKKLLGFLIGCMVIGGAVRMASANATLQCHCVTASMCGTNVSNWQSYYSWWTMPSLHCGSPEDFPCQCPAGQVLDKSKWKCVAVGCTSDQELVLGNCVSKCLAGQVRVNGTCQDVVIVVDPTPIPQCSPTYEKINGTCVPQCSESQERINGVCVNKEIVCAASEEKINGICVPKCLDTQERVNGVCQTKEVICPAPEEKIDGVCVRGCTSDQERINGVCVAKCLANQDRIDGQCVTREILCEPTQDKIGETCVPKCLANQDRINGQCVNREIVCDPTQDKIGETCVPKCSANQIRGADGVCQNIPSQITAVCNNADICGELKCTYDRTVLNINQDRANDPNPDGSYDALLLSAKHRYCDNLPATCPIPTDCGNLPALVPVTPTSTPSTNTGSNTGTSSGSTLAKDPTVPTVATPPDCQARLQEVESCKKPGSGFAWGNISSCLAGKVHAQKGESKKQALQRELKYCSETVPGWRDQYLSAISLKKHK